MNVIEIPFAKLHGAENDFLITWADHVLDHVPALDLPALARHICARTTGIGADGWMLAWRTEGGLRTRLFNSDGSEPELSGNGTRCAGAFAYWEGCVTGSELIITTSIGPKRLTLIEHSGLRFQFEMDMGLPEFQSLRTKLTLGGSEWDAALLNVGNPQCVLFVDAFPENWRAIAAEAESLPRFPQRSNVSVVKRISDHVVDVLFFERGAGETRSSGTGSTGAAVAAIERGVSKSPVEVRTPAGSMLLRWDDSVYLSGPAEFIGRGSYSYRCG